MMFFGVKNINDTPSATTNNINSLGVLRPLITMLHNLLLVCESQLNSTSTLQNPGPESASP